MWAHPIGHSMLHSHPTRPTRPTPPSRLTHNYTAQTHPLYQPPPLIPHSPAKTICALCPSPRLDPHITHSPTMTMPAPTPPLTHKDQARPSTPHPHTMTVCAPHPPLTHDDPVCALPVLIQHAQVHHAAAPGRKHTVVLHLCVCGWGGGAGRQPTLVANTRLHSTCVLGVWGAGGLGV